MVLCTWTGLVAVGAIPSSSIMLALCFFVALLGTAPSTAGPVQVQKAIMTQA